MTASNTTPEGFRTAAYLATRARLDAARSRSGKTSRSVDCNPPNVKCGGRCIPPSWDCRIKGEGPDPHLRAVRTDPVSGLANIERGVKRIGKGLRTGSFSEIEGGKRAIVRGVVKATPGDIQRKKALGAQLERRAAGIALGLSVVAFGLFSHNQLKRAPFYRDGVGRRIDDAVSAGINRVLDATPGIGARRAERRAAGREAGMAAVSRAATTAASGPDTLRGGILRTPTDLERRSTEYGNSRVLFNRISSVDIDAASRKTNLENWRQTSLESFWGTKRTNAAGAGDGSTFSEPATHEFLSRQFGFRLGPNTDDTQVRRAVATALTREAVSLQGLARQQGVNLKDADARSAFLNRIVGSSTANFPEDVRARAVKNLDDVLGNPVSKGREATISRKELADRYYRETRDGFDQYFARIADEVRQTPGVAMPRAQRQAGYGDLMASAKIGHSRYLAGRLGKTLPSMGPGVSDVVAKEYFATQVQKSSTFSLSDREVRVAASELSGRNITSISEATQYLQSNGFPRLVAVQRAPSRASGGLRSAASLTALARRIIARTGNENMSLEAALRQARAEMRGDAADLPIRVRTYLEARRDFKEGGRLGKPCGESHIPKTYECSKGAAGSSSDGSKKIAIIAAVVGGAVAIGVAGTVAYNVKTISDPSKTPLTASPNIRDVVKTAKAEARTKSASQAMGHYYVNKSGLKPGDVVYFRTEKDPSAHFGVYLGPGKDGIVRAVIANTKASRFSWSDVAEIGSIKPGVKAAQAVMPPLRKAPTPQFLQGGKGPYTPEEIVRRAIRISSTDYTFSVTRNNCETLANTIAYGVPKSEQLDRFNRVTKVMVDFTVGRGQRSESERAIFEGRAQGRSYTAAEFSKFLEGKRAFSSPEGKNLAQQYDTYFKGYNLDARNAPDYLGLISPSELWSRINTYEAPVRAQAMSNYLFTLRTLKEMAQN